MKVTKEQRTAIQNNALHLFFELVAEALNDAGYDVQAVIRHQMDIPWSKTMVKELIWKSAQKVYIGEKSTTKLSTQDVSRVYDIVNRFLGEKFGITVPFPSDEELST